MTSDTDESGQETRPEPMDRDAATAARTRALLRTFILKVVCIRLPIWLFLAWSISRTFGWEWAWIEVAGCLGVALLWALLLFAMSVVAQNRVRRREEERKVGPHGPL